MTGLQLGRGRGFIRLGNGIRFHLLDFWRHIKLTVIQRIGSIGRPNGNENDFMIYEQNATQQNTTQQNETKQIKTKTSIRYQ